MIDETYERENTKEWLNKTLILSFKKQMKENYFTDEHKMTNQSGRRNQQSNSNNQHRGGKFRTSGSQFPNDGAAAQKPYIDYDDPEVNAKRHAARDSANARQLVDYSDLFGWKHANNIKTYKSRCQK